MKFPKEAHTHTTQNQKIKKLQLQLKFIHSRVSFAIFLLDDVIYICMYGR